MRALAVLLLLLSVSLPVMADDLDAAIGEKLFARRWLVAPASAAANDGLGPMFDARSCAECHAGKRRTVIRLGDEAGRADPVYGFQFQEQAVPGVPPEGKSSSDIHPRFADLAYGPMADRTHAERRIAPSLDAVAALMAVSESAIEAQAARSGGRVRRLADGAIGRLGWKAAQPTFAHQIAAAFSTDLGLSTGARMTPYGDCTSLQTACRAAPTGAPEGRAEVAEPIIAALAAFLASRHPSPLPQNAAGLALFAATGCDACHVPSLPDANGKPVTLFSDLLLHDMGPGLDSGVGEPGVASSEWRTAPLIGLGKRAGSGLLHDGRATSVAAAILWHHGTGETAASRYRALPEGEREALLAFLGSL